MVVGILCFLHDRRLKLTRSVRPHASIANRYHIFKVKHNFYFQFELYTYIKILVSTYNLCFSRSDFLFR
jgi:hypothetical protein